MNSLPALLVTAARVLNRISGLAPAVVRLAPTEWTLAPITITPARDTIADGPVFVATAATLPAVRALEVNLMSG